MLLFGLLILGGIIWLVLCVTDFGDNIDIKPMDEEDKRQMRNSFNAMFMYDHTFRRK